MKLYRQVKLGSGNIEATVNLEDSPHLKVGVQLKLKDHEKLSNLWWVVKSVSKHAQAKPKTHWNNNI